MDSDDYVLDNYINTLLGYIEDGQYDLYGFDYIDDTGDDEYVERAGCAYVWSGLYRLSYLNNIRFDNLFSLYGFGEDAFFYDSFKATLPKCKYTKDKIYVYRWDTEGGISNEKNEGRRCITWYA